MFLVLPFKKAPLLVEDADNTKLNQYTQGADVLNFKYTDEEGTTHTFGMVGTAVFQSPAQVRENPTYATKYNGGVTDFLSKECELFGSIVGDVLLFGVSGGVSGGKPATLPVPVAQAVLPYISGGTALQPALSVWHATTQL